MTPQIILPTVLIIIDFGAAIVYAIAGDARNATYWLAAGILSVCVVYR